MKKKWLNTILIIICLCEVTHEAKYMKIVKIQRRINETVIRIPNDYELAIDGIEYMKCKEDGHGSIVLTPVVD